MVQIYGTDNLWHDFASGKLKYYKLYTNGVQNVAWDNGIYSAASYSTLMGGFTLNDTNVVVPPVTTEGHNYTFVTQKSIDFSKYSKLKIVIDGEEKSYDIISINISGYVCFASFTGSGLCHFEVVISPTKENFHTNQVFMDYAYQNATAKYLTITEIWLEP